MRLVDDINECTLYLQNTPHPLATLLQEISGREWHDLVKYYAYQYLIQTYPEEAFISQQSLDDLLAHRQKAQAQATFVHIRTEFMKRSQQDNLNFSKLLGLFANYYDNTPEAFEATEWATSLIEQRSWFSMSYSILYDVCRSTFNFAVEHPVLSVFFLVLASAATAKADQQTTSDKMVEVLDDLPGSFRPNYISTMDSEFEAHSDQLDEKVVDELLKLKIIVSPSLEKTIAAEIKPKCDELRLIIKTAILNKQDHHNLFVRIIAQTKVNEIHCMNTSADYLMYGRYDRHGQIIQVVVNAIRSDVLSSIIHEALHADAYSRHFNALCPPAKNEFESLSPVYESTQGNIDEWNRAFDLGDERIAEFYRLWTKISHGEKLTSKEILKCKTYIDACAGVRPIYIIFKGVNKSSYEKYKNTMTTNSDFPGNFYGIQSNGKIEFVSDFAKEYTARLRITSLWDTVFMVPPRLKINLMSDVYSMITPAELLGEREAHTFMSLPPLAAKTFYKEVYNFRERDIQKCDPDYLNIPKVNQRLRIGLFYKNPYRTLSQNDANKAFKEANDLASTAYSMDAIDEAIERLKKLIKLPNINRSAQLLLDHLIHVKFDDEEAHDKCEYVKAPTLE